MDERKITERALRDVVGEREPSLDNLLGAVPDMMARAEEIRASRADRIIASIPLARWLIPRLSFATAALVLLAATLLISQSAQQQPITEGTGTLEALMLGQNGREFSTALLLDTIVDTGEER
jgi:hypothetical protein